MKSALVILFNQDFSKNIPKLEQIYGGRFATIVYLTPDHYSRLHRCYTERPWPQWLPFLLDRGYSAIRRAIGKKNLYEAATEIQTVLGTRFLRVVGHQFHFYYFLVQAADALLALDVDWYWVVGDDALINPSLNEASLPLALGMTTQTDAVLCRPVIGSDAWIAKIAESVPIARRCLRAALGDYSPLQRGYAVKPEAGALKNTDIAVACADFFGVSKRCLQDVLPLWRRCFREKLYVEMAFPNSLLQVAGHPVFTDRFYWQRVADAKESIALVERFCDDPPYIFVHPVKLSAIDEDMVNLLRKEVLPIVDSPVTMTFGKP